MNMEKVKSFVNLKGYSGADFMSMLNGEVLGEVHSFRSNSIDNLIEVDVDMFNTILNIDKEFRKTVNGDFINIFSNGEDTIVKQYENLKYVGQKCSHSIDDKEIISTYIFKYGSESEYSMMGSPLVESIEKYKRRKSY